MNKYDEKEGGGEGMFKKKKKIGSVKFGEMTDRPQGRPGGCGGRVSLE